MKNMRRIFFSWQKLIKQSKISYMKGQSKMSEKREAVAKFSFWAEK